MNLSFSNSSENDRNALPHLSIPKADLKLATNEAGAVTVYDILRKKYVALTPEEYVRQNFIHWLINSYGYPASLMANEVEINLNDTRKRCDTIVYGRELEPLVIVEYKAPDVEITQDTFDQIARYNMKLKAKYLIVSNGVRHYTCVLDYARNTYHFIRVIPSYADAKGMPGVN